MGYLLGVVYPAYKSFKTLEASERKVR